MMPTKMSKKGKTFHSQARAIVNNVKICLKKKKAMKTLKFPISQATKRTTEATKITESTIKKKKKSMQWKNSKKILVTFYQLPESTAKGLKVVIAKWEILKTWDHKTLTINSHFVSYVTHASSICFYVKLC